MKNPKNKFYRTLNLDKETRQVISEFNKIKTEMMNDSELKNYEEEENE